MESQNIPVYAPVVLKLLQGPIYNDDSHWERLQSYLTPVREYFGKIGLEVRNFERDGFAYLEQPPPDPEDKAKPLPRLTVRHRLSYKVTILCVLLREELRQHEINSTISRLVLSIEKIRDLLLLYLPEHNNEEKFRREVGELVKQAVDLSFLKRLSGEEENYEVRPILKAKIDAETLSHLKEKLENYAKSSSI
jgi:hypothetical protein